MQQEELVSSYAGRDDLELLRAAAVEKPSDLVASLVHVSREGKLPLTTAATTSVRTESALTQQLQFLTQHQHVVPQVDKQHNLQVSQITISPGTQTSIASSTYSSYDSPALDSAQLTEPFSPALPLYNSESAERSPMPIGQCKPSGQ
jgi:hypothetical protein